VRRLRGSPLLSFTLAAQYWRLCGRDVYREAGAELCFLLEHCYIASSGWIVHYLYSCPSQAAVCAWTLNYVHILLDWITVQVATEILYA